MEPQRCDACGESFSDRSLLASHRCSGRPAAPRRKQQPDGYKCSQCGEVFPRPAALERHFKTLHGRPDPGGPFPCREKGCQFSSTDRQEYQSHLTSTHGLTLIPCAFRSCNVAFLTQADLESHRRGHMPFGCFHCRHVAQNAKELSRHVSEHSHTQGNETEPSTARTNGSRRPPAPGRPKRKKKSDATCAPSSTEGGAEADLESQGRHGKRARKAVERDGRAPADAAPPPSKEYLAEGAEHTYHTHTCPECRRCFKMRSHLREHLHLHFPDPDLQCPTCKHFFTSKSKLRVHRLREAGQKLHRCHLCEYSAVERHAIRRHLVTVHAEEAEGATGCHSYPCPACGQSFRQSRSLKAHMKTHNVVADSKPVACFQENCSFQSPLRKALLRHAAEAHGVQAVECRHHACSAIFQGEKDMEAHYRTHRAYHCPQCNFSCSNKTVFLQHRRHGHPGSDKLRCEFCAFVTFNPVEFEQHVGHLHANEKIHRCCQCSYVTSHKRGLKRHMLMHSGEKPHKCSLCDFRCRDESYLSKHMLTHSDDKNFMCAECGYVTKWKHYLNVHMRKHAGDLRYKCDQCPYRCHRMDQLNSHKLRHQPKSLMCEICAYACKRRYELHNHMLAKHSGEGKQPSVHKCKYCTYTTCYRQALQNHENCKHTKLKEFRCALCSYSSFSSISLFLHKRKAHGYVPGDKAWLECYAAKERKRNSTESLQDFYNKPLMDNELSEEGPTQRAQSDPPGSADNVANKGTGAASPVNIMDVVSQEVVPRSPLSGNSPEYCTLVLTTLPTTDYGAPSLQTEEEDCPSTSTLVCNRSDASQEKNDFSMSASSSEEDGMPTADKECEESDDNCEARDNVRQPLEPGKCQTETPEVEIDCGTTSLTFPPEKHRPSESEIRSEALKKLDKDQAEAMVLEGRVQMVAVPAEEPYRCDSCSHVSRTETALRSHRQSSCRGGIMGHEWQACGAPFEQIQGLDSHLAKKCSAPPRQMRAVTGVSATSVATESNAGLDGSEQLSGGANSCDQDFHQPEVEVYASDTTNREGLTHSASSESGHQQGNVQTRRSLKVKPLCTKEDGKFKCKLRSFSSVKHAAGSRNTSACQKIFQKNSKNGESVGIKEDLAGLSGGPQGVSKEMLSCPNCAFTCKQRRALDRHTKRGCLKPEEVQCAACSFVAKSRMSLSRHVLHVHKAKAPAVAAAERLHCQSCGFTCKREASMAQHVDVKHRGARSHRCRYCPFGTARRYRLEEHESLHTGIGRHSCDVCDRTFGALAKLRQHKTRIHDGQPSRPCSLCDFSGHTPDDVKRHKLRCHTGELHHACARCEARFSSEAALRKHCKRAHQLQVGFPCKQCDCACGSEAELRTHQQSKHAQIRCAACRETFETKESLDLHHRIHLAHRCQLCPFAAKTRRLLAQHLLKEHEEGPPLEKPLKCSSCQFTCRHQLVLEQHLRSHGGKRLYKCADCKYSTRNKQKITWHIRIHTGEKPYSCERCSYACADPSRLKLHMRVHQDEKKYLCPECGYKCKWATQLKYHMTKHTGEKPHACDQCDYRTNRADALRAHRDTQHCDARPYICEKCGKAFKTSFVLKTHQRQHSDDRPYACGLCHKAFRWPAGLRHHYLSHTKQQPFRCRHCSYRAKQRFQVVKHLQRHHPEVSAEQGVARDSEAASLTLKEALQGALDKSAAEVGEDEG